jgi:hypothetical protein
MQERFQDAEIRVAQFRPLDALRCVGEQRLKRFHENKPGVAVDRLVKRGLVSRKDHPVLSGR